MYTVLVRKPEGKIPIGSPEHRWEVNIRMDLREIGQEDVDWMHLGENKDQ
jgi:hypothetical protein